MSNRGYDRGYDDRRGYGGSNNRHGRGTNDSYYGNDRRRDSDRYNDERGSGYGREERGYGRGGESRGYDDRGYDNRGYNDRGYSGGGNRGGDAYYGGGGGSGHYGGSSYGDRGGGGHYGRQNQGHGGGGRGYGGSSYDGGGRDRYGNQGSRDGGRGGGNSFGGRGGGNSFGGRGGGNSFGGRGGRGGRGGTRAPRRIAGECETLTNIIPAALAPCFQFRLYVVEAVNDKGENIDSRHRRKQLFEHGLEKVLIPGMSNVQKEKTRCDLLFAGSYFFSSRPVEGLDKLPRTICDGQGTDGDRLAIKSVQVFSAPVDLQENGAGDEAKEDSSGSVKFELRCADCTTVFTGLDSLLNHCQTTGHAPVFYKDGDSDDDEPTPAGQEVFTSYVNMALQRALSERMARWGTTYVDPKTYRTPEDKHGRSLGVHVFQAYDAKFTVNNIEDKTTLALTVDLRAKLIRTRHLLDHLCRDQDPTTFRFSEPDMERAKREWIGETVISTLDKNCYTVTDLFFADSPDSLPVRGLKNPDGSDMTHTQYYEQRKGFTLKYPSARPMVEVLGRRKSKIYLPAEIICGNELDPDLKMKLPMIASFTPQQRSDAINEIKAHLVPGAQKSKGGFLPAVGVILKDERLVVPAEVLPVPVITAAGIRIPDNKANNWAPSLNQATFNVEGNQVVELKVVVFRHHALQRWEQVYNRIRDMVNRHNSNFRFPDRPFAVVSAGEMDSHWQGVEKHFSSQQPDNVFLLDLTKPRTSVDPAYNVVKKILATGGYLSQFVNFKKCDHLSGNNKSNTILQGVARQVLSKCGVVIWWCAIPKSLPLPCVFVGVDIFHAARAYDPVKKTKTAKSSCAAVVVQVIRNANGEGRMRECYSQTFKKEAGKEDDLDVAIETTMCNALKNIDVSPASCVVWRDGVGDGAIDSTSAQEVASFQRALSSKAPRRSEEDGSQKARKIDVPLAYMICQKRVATKFITPDGQHGMPAGTLVQGLDKDYPTFYLNGTAPPFSTPKPVRFIITKRDEGLEDTPLTDLSWSMCHDYSNWAGPIKVPSVVQLAHKLAEHAGTYPDCGESINHKAFTNQMYFL